MLLKAFFLECGSDLFLDRVKTGCIHRALFFKQDDVPAIGALDGRLSEIPGFYVVQCFSDLRGRLVCAKPANFSAFASGRGIFALPCEFLKSSAVVEFRDDRLGLILTF